MYVAGMEEGVEDVEGVEWLEEEGGGGEGGRRR